MTHERALRRAVLALAAPCILGTLACDGAPAPVAPDAVAAHALAPSSGPVAQASPGADVNRDLAAIRRLTAPFHRLAAAQAAGWGTRITDCLESAAGGQGFHYGNTAHIDGEVQLLEPELLLYEPEGSGRYRLVGVEYIVPLDAWEGAEPPTLLGQEFHVNETFGVWALHVWLWRENPSGLFADWNPLVRCDAAS